MSFRPRAWPLSLLFLTPMLWGMLAASGLVDGQSNSVTAGSIALPAGSGIRGEHINGEIQGDGRIRHALDRLTFGPRPGDFRTVKALGVAAWINLQLQPDKIDDSVLQEKLKNYPVMQMSVPDLIKELPPPPLIRQVADGKSPLPEDITLQKVYQTQILIDQRQQQTQAAKRFDQQTLQTTQTSTMPTAESRSSRPAIPPPGEVMYLDVKEQDKKTLAELHIDEVIKLPPQQRIASVLSMPPEARAAVAEGLSPQERQAFVQGMTPAQAQLFSSLSSPVRTVASQLQATKMLSVIDSNRQLQEVMTDFWLNHFNIDIHKSPLMAYYLADYEDKVIRPNALGNFEELLDATAHSRAMLLYLDNDSSVGPDSPAALGNVQRAANAVAGGKRKNLQLGLNENYGRELMELHTLGVDGGYNQNDVIAVAKVFTGWSVDKPLQGGGFVFNPRRHEPGPKYVLGHTIQESGEQEGLQVLHLLATSPATAHHISEELAERFVSDDPPQTLVKRMSRTFLATHGDIRQVLHTMFFSPEFWARGTVHAKVKTPLELVASAARASDTQVNSPGILAVAVAQLGMPLYGCQPPNGYSLNGDVWISAGSLVERMSFAMAFADNRLPGIVNHWYDFLGPNASSMEPSDKESRIEHALMYGDISIRTRETVRKQLASGKLRTLASPFPLGADAGRGYIPPASLPLQSTNPAASRDSEVAMSAGLLLGSPEFQSH